MASSKNCCEFLVGHPFGIQSFLGQHYAGSDSSVLELLVAIVACVAQLAVEAAVDVVDVVVVDPVEVCSFPFALLACFASFAKPVGLVAQFEERKLAVVLLGTTMVMIGALEG